METKVKQQPRELRTLTLSEAIDLITSSTYTECSLALDRATRHPVILKHLESDMWEEVGKSELVHLRWKLEQNAGAKVGRRMIADALGLVSARRVIDAFVESAKLWKFKK